jgi:hypothetical protein
MFEALIVLALIGLFSLAGWATEADAETLVRSGMALSTLGFAFGIPTAIVYHWRLYASLRRAQRLPRGWWISPTRHHALIPAEDRCDVLRWGGLGGAGFAVIVVGLALTSTGLWRLLTA